jgi:VanZ family protein
MTPRSLRQRLFLWAPPLAYMGLIFHFSSESDPLPALTTTVWDKALHFVEYGGLGVLLCRAFTGEGLGLIIAAISAVIVASLYGASDEWHQLFTPGRSSDVYDWLTDTIGGGLGAAAYLVAVALSTASRPPRPPQR